MVDYGHLEPVNVKSTFAIVQKPSQPHLVSELDVQYVQLVKLQDPFVWHYHDSELFFCCSLSVPNGVSGS